MKLRLPLIRHDCEAASLDYDHDEHMHVVDARGHCATLPSASEAHRGGRYDGSTAVQLLLPTRVQAPLADSTCFSTGNYNSQKHVGIRPCDEHAKTTSSPVNTDANYVRINLFLEF